MGLRARKTSNPDISIAQSHNREVIKKIWKRKGKRDLVDRDSGWTHGFSKRIAPYPLAYDLKLMDFDDFDTTYFAELHGGVSIHDFGGKPPSSSLDLGCGRGTAILQLAQQWPNCRFVGMDLVKIQPDPQYLKPPLDSRVRWVQANFLETLPFLDRSFDHVRLSRIALAVPENKWDFLFEEITRVLRPGGVVEILEENLFFPCGSVNRKADLSPQLGRFRTEIGPPSTPPSRSGFPRTNSVGTDSYNNTSSSALPTPEIPLSPSVSRPRPSLHLPFHATYLTETEPEDDGVPMGQKRGAPWSSGYFGADSGYGGSAATYKSHSTASSSSKHNAEGTIGNKAKRKSRWRYEAVISRSKESDAGTSHGPTITSSIFHNTPPHKPKLAPHPRDHSILKAAYEQVLGERFINPNPLSILPYYMGLHLENVKSCHTVQFPLPAPSGTKNPSHSPSVRGGSKQFPPNAAAPSPSSPTSATPLPHHSIPSTSASKPMGRMRSASVTTPGSASSGLGVSSNRSSLNPTGKTRHKHDSGFISSKAPSPLQIQQQPTSLSSTTAQLPKSPSTVSFDESLYRRKSSNRGAPDSRLSTRSGNGGGVPSSPVKTSSSRRSSLVNGVPSSHSPPPPVPPIQALHHRPSTASAVSGSSYIHKERITSFQLGLGSSLPIMLKNQAKSGSDDDFSSALHLARAFQTVVSCKDEIRRQFMKMEDDMIDEMLPKYTQSSTADPTAGGSSVWDEAGFSPSYQPTARTRSGDDDYALSADEVDEFDDDMAEMSRSEMFDYLWRNYELDMKDRMSMRDVVNDNIGTLINGSGLGVDPVKIKQSNAWKARIERADWRLENMDIEEKKTGPPVPARSAFGGVYGYRKRAESAATTNGQNMELSRLVRWFVAFKKEAGVPAFSDGGLVDDAEDLAITFAKRTSSDEEGDIYTTDSD